MPDFRIYYGDGTIFEGTPENAPVDDVQVIAYDDPDQGGKRCTVYNHDMYVYSDVGGEWVGTSNYVDLLRRLKLGCGPGGVRAVLEGRWLAAQEYADISQRAREDRLDA